MPVIEPVSIEECIEFAENSREDIVEGVYDIKIRPEWIESLPQEVVNLFVSHCDASKSVIASTLDPDAGGLETLMKLAEDSEQSVREAVASNPKTPVKALEKLSFDYFKEVREAVARNPASPPKVLQELSQDKSFEVRAAIAENLSLPLGVLNRLASDRSETIRNKIVEQAQDPKTDPRLLEKLSKSNAPLVRAAVANNASTPVRLLNILERDQRTEVRKAAHGNWLKLARSPKVDIDQLTRLATHTSKQVRLAVAKNSRSPATVLDMLSRDTSGTVRIAVARHPRCPAEAFKTLGKDTETEIRATIAANPKCSTDVLGMLNEKATSPRVREALAANPTEVARRKSEKLCVDCGKKIGALGIMLKERCAGCMIKG